MSELQRVEDGVCRAGKIHLEKRLAINRLEVGLKSKF